MIMSQRDMVLPVLVQLGCMSHIKEEKDLRTERISQAEIPRFQLSQ